MEKFCLAKTHHTIAECAQIEIVMGYLVSYMNYGNLGNYIPICVVDPKIAANYLPISGLVAGWTASWTNYAPEEAWHHQWTPEGDIVVVLDDNHKFK
jgi:hypothetical protein